MQLSKQEIDPELEDAIEIRLYQALLEMHSYEEMSAFLQDLLTEAELVAFSKRLAIAQGLLEKQSYESIRDTLKVSSATIASVQERLKSNGVGIKRGLERLNQVESGEGAGDGAGLMGKVRKFWK